MFHEDIEPVNCCSELNLDVQLSLWIAFLSMHTCLSSDCSAYRHKAWCGGKQLEDLLKLMLYYCCTALLEELETLVEQLDQQEAAKQQVLRRAEAAERELEALKAERPQMAAVSALLCLGCRCTMQLPGLDCVGCLIHVLLQPFNGVPDV